MAVVPPRQVAVLSIANYDEVVSALGPEEGDAAIADLRALAVSCGVDPGYMRRMGRDTLLLRLDDLPREDFLAAISCMASKVHELTAPHDPSLPLVLRVGAMSERALRSFVNDAAVDLIAYMNHMELTAAFLAGDEIDIWQSLKSTDIAFISHEQLKKLDPFTGLLKPEHFFALLQEVLDGGPALRDGVSVLYLDIDDFKSYNRTFDHNQGDELLLFVAQQIRDAFPSDLVCHLSIDRFAVLTNSRDIVRQVAAIHSAVRSFRWPFAPELKCGVFALEDGVDSAHVAVDCAKLACESIKGRYDVGCSIFADELKERLFARRYVARNAEQAVHNGWICTYAQPVVYTDSGELCGFEALARWDDPERGLLSPALFIPTLEDARLIHKLDACVVWDVCRHLATRQGKGLEVVPASVNLSRLDFGLCDMLEQITEACARWGIPHDMLAIEITESALTSNGTDLRKEMDRFRAAGFEVWMDDFGCGYSSLNLLKDYEFDVLKVDMEFLRDMEGNDRSKTIVTSVIDMARSLGIRTLVEGVETPAQRDFLREAGCDMMQGYLFGRPMPLSLNLL